MLPISFSLNSCKKDRPPVIEEVTYELLNCAPPYRVQFWYKQKERTILSDQRCVWNWGDGKPDYAYCGSVIHTFNDPGIYTVKLLIQHEGGIAEKNITVNISSTSYPVRSSFSVNRSSSYPDCLFRFTNKSQYATNYYWDFGDGNFSTSENPTHYYSRSGRYLVKLHAYCSDQERISSMYLDVFNNPMYFRIDKLYYKMPGNLANADTDEADTRPDLYWDIYYGDDYMGSTNVIYNASSNDLYWPGLSFSFPIYSSSRNVTMYLYDYDASSADDYTGISYSFTTGWLDDNCYPRDVDWDNLEVDLVYGW